MLNKKVEKEFELVELLKGLMDEGHNFVKPLSEFWRGSDKNECCVFGVNGLWITNECTIHDKPVADYYNEDLFDGSPELKSFMRKYDLYLTWYDPETIFLEFKPEQLVYKFNLRKNQN